MCGLRVVLLSMLLVASVRMAGAQPSASLVLLNGKVWTVNDAQPRAEAVACLGSRIVAVGSNDQIRRWVGADTQVIDLGGKLVLPGFNDAHVHFFDGGENLASVQLRDAKSEDEFRQRIAAFAAKPPAGRWITGGDWDHENWTPARLPTRQLIDAVTPGHPVFVNRLDGHMALANSQALQLAGITRDTPDPPGGTIVRDAAGEPTGVLKDAAMSRVYARHPGALPGPDRGRRARGHALRRGEWRHQRAGHVRRARDPARLSALLARGELTVRISGHQPLATWQRLAAVGLRADFGGEKLHIGGLKGFADGSLGSTTALFFEPYLDAPQHCGPGEQRDDPGKQDAEPHPGRGSRRAAGGRTCHRRQSQPPGVGNVRRGRAAERRARPALSHRARPAPAGGRYPALRQAARDRLHAAVSLHRRRPLGGKAHRPGARQDHLCVPRAAGFRRGAGLRLGLGRGADGSL